MASQNSSAHADYLKFRSLLEFNSSRDHGGAVIARIKDLQVSVNREPRADKNQRVTLRDLRRIENAVKFFNASRESLLSAVASLHGLEVSKIEADFASEVLLAYVDVLNSLVESAMQRRIEAQAVKNV